MTVRLYHRNFGIHTFIKEVKVDGTLRKYAKRPKNPNDDYTIKEAELIKALPKGFLPVKPKEILLTIDEKYISRGQAGLKLFRNWAKYFPSYSIGLSN